METVLEVTHDKNLVSCAEGTVNIVVGRLGDLDYIEA